MYGFSTSFGVLCVVIIRLIALHVPSGSYIAHCHAHRKKINKERFQTTADGPEYLLGCFMWS